MMIFSEVHSFDLTDCEHIYCIRTRSNTYPFLQVPGGTKATSLTVGTVTDGIERFCGRVWTINVIGSGTVATRSVCSKFPLLPLKAGS